MSCHSHTCKGKHRPQSRSRNHHSRPNPQSSPCEPWTLNDAQIQALNAQLASLTPTQRKYYDAGERELRAVIRSLPHGWDLHYLPTPPLKSGESAFTCEFPEDKVVVLESPIPVNADTLLTWFHELTHVVNRHGKSTELDSTVEWEAESTAYKLMHKYGFAIPADTVWNSSAYIGNLLLEDAASTKGHKVDRRAVDWVLRLGVGRVHAADDWQGKLQSAVEQGKVVPV